MKYFIGILSLVSILTGCQHIQQDSSSVLQDTGGVSCEISNDSSDDGDVYKSFSQPIMTGCSLSSGTLPRKDFSSQIFLSSSENNSFIVLFFQTGTLTGEVIDDTTKLFLIASGSQNQMEVLLVGKEFRVDYTTLSLQKGENIFLLRAVRPIGVSQRILSIRYVPVDNIQDKIYTPSGSGKGPYTCEIDLMNLDRHYCQISDSFRIGIQRNYKTGTTLSDLSTSVRYESKTSSRMRQGVMIQPLMEEIDPVVLTLRPAQKGLILNMYNQYFGQGREYLFDTTKKQWTDIHRSWMMPLEGTGVYEYYGAVWSGNSVLISEFSYCCKSTKNKLQNYQYLFSLDGNLISKRKLKN